MHEVIYLHIEIHTLCDLSALCELVPPWTEHNFFCLKLYIPNVNTPFKPIVLAYYDLLKTINMSDELINYKAKQKTSWGLFTPLELLTTLVAPKLIQFSGIKAHAHILDVGCGTGVTAVTAARMGARVSALDLSPALLEKAELNAQLAQVIIDFKEGDVEQLPYPDASFDTVLSQFGHMFAPNAQKAIDEMLRVLKPGGVIAFTTWPTEHFIGQLFALISKYNPLPHHIDLPEKWGEPDYIKYRLGNRITNGCFDYGIMHVPTMSLGHYLNSIEKNLSPVANLVQRFGSDSCEMNKFRNEVRNIAEIYYHDNILHQAYIMYRAAKLT
ncbi:class I SAM-dependent methyltransferase [Legionella longbeachae]|uniref:class I SAM-dependent methyltransferase n=1 Tax=Legionella longbeachae TaxID=450 RepID=UPI001CD9FE00|nr:class I SAM-dependent methyltransferase [Legionella longbeachae]